MVNQRQFPKKVEKSKNNVQIKKYVVQEMKNEHGNLRTSHLELRTENLELRKEWKMSFFFLYKVEIFLHYQSMMNHES